MAEILFIDTNTTPFNEAFPVYPIGLDYLQGAVDQAGLGRPEILDLTRAGGPLGPQGLGRRTAVSLDVMERRLAAKPWDAVCLSLRNIDSTYPILGDDPSLHYYLPQLNQYLDLVQAKAAPETRVILGGTAFSIMPEAFLGERPDSWHGVIGPAESTLVEMLADLDAGRPVERLVAGGAHNAPGSLQNERLLSAYLGLPQGEGTFGLRTKIGCGQACGYCPYPLINGPRQTLKDPAAVLEEIKFLEAVHKKHPQAPPLRFMFADDIFNRPLEHAKAVLEAMLIEELIPASWHAYLDPKNLDEDFLELVIRTNGWSTPGPEGQRFMFFPLDIESGSDRILKSLRKPFRAADILASAEGYRQVTNRWVATRSLDGAGLGIHLLLGYPGEDEDSIRETCELINRAGPDQIAVQLGVRVYPGTPLSRQVAGELWQEEEDLYQPVFVEADEDRIMGWMRKYLDLEYDRLARRGKMLLIGRSGE